MWAVRAKNPSEVWRRPQIMISTSTL
eukprot:COSAG02_NODE_52069_length_310_cov_0.734597_1_plen_25_part_01